jgi:uncharacterized protein YoxC
LRSIAGTSIGVIFVDMNGVPGWVPPTVAISLVFIALSFVAVAAVVVISVRRISARVGELQRRLNPLMDTVDRLADAGEDLGEKIRDEVERILETSRRLRRSTIRGARRVRGRLQDLDALYEVVSGEVQDTALDLAAKLRTVRTGASFLQRIRRLLIRGRR